MDIEVGVVTMADINDIVVSDRARKEMGDLNGLEENIRANGLISPLAVKDNKDGTLQLLAGERRYTVLKRNNVDKIPVRIYSNALTDLEMKVIEKSENFFRKDFEYWELDKLTAEIHSMQQSIHGVQASGPIKQGWGTADTGEMIGGVSKAAVSQAIKRAQAREALPELFEGCKTAFDATKVIKKLDESLIKQTIADKISTQKSDSDLVRLSNKFIIKDFFEGVKEIPEGAIHLVEIDPPYAIDLNKIKKTSNISQYDEQLYNEISIENYPNFLSKLFTECYRVMSDHSWLICWYAPEPWFNDVYKALISSGFSTTRMCGIWTKPTGQNQQPQIKLTNQYEMFFYAWKGRPALNKPAHSNVYNTPPVPAAHKTHPTERPVELMQELYSTFAFPGSRLLIPFLGSGNGLIAADSLGLNPIGFELSKGYKDSFLVKVNEMGKSI